MKIKNKIVFLLTTILLLISTFVFTYAYFISQTSIDDITFKVGNISINLEGSVISGYGSDLNGNGYIVPGVNLIEEPFRLTNSSSVNIDIKLIIEVKIYDEVLLEYRDLTNDEIEGGSFILLVIGPNIINNGDDSYTIIGLEPLTTSVSLIDSLILDGTKVKNDYSNREIKINIRFLARQSDHVDFEDLGDFDLI